jgi:hypothetical protein
MWPPLVCNIRVSNLREGIGEGQSRVEGQTTEFTIKRNSFERFILHKGDRQSESPVAAHAQKMSAHVAVNYPSTYRPYSQFHSDALDLE